MTLEQLNEKVRAWDLQHTGGSEAKSKYSAILAQLYYHSAREWRTYLPAEHPSFNRSYMERLARWIGNLSEEHDQKPLLEYALNINFFSHNDFAALYRTAMEREIKRWVASQIGARLDPDGALNFSELVNREVSNRTWFCPITDSMDINEFYKVNHLRGIGHRPGFSTLEMLAQRTGVKDPFLAQSIEQYMANPSLDPARPAQPLERIVLLEDIVGSGTQCIEAIRWVARNIKKPVLFVPLILCPNGVDLLHSEEVASSGMLTVRPVVKLRRSDLLGPERNGAGGGLFTLELEDLVDRCKSRFAPGMNMFGFRGTGCSLVTFANTPDNTLPIVHNKPRSGAWEPLFPRVFRD